MGKKKKSQDAELLEARAKMLAAIAALIAAVGGLAKVCLEIAQALM